MISGNYPLKIFLFLSLRASSFDFWKLPFSTLAVSCEPSKQYAHVSEKRRVMEILLNVAPFCSHVTIFLFTTIYCQLNCYLVSVYKVLLHDYYIQVQQELMMYTRDIDMYP